MLSAGPGQAQTVSQALQRAFQLSPVGAPMPDPMSLRLPAAGAPLPSLTQALPRLSMVPSPLPSLDQLLGTALPLPQQSPPVIQADAGVSNLAKISVIRRCYLHLACYPFEAIKQMAARAYPAWSIWAPYEVLCLVNEERRMLLFLLQFPFPCLLS